MNSAKSDDQIWRVLCGQRPLVIAHRGFSGIAPENTTPAFELALAAEADVVELDARVTRDQKLIVIHDHEFDRTTDAKRKWRRRHNRVEARSASEIKELDAGGWFHRKLSPYGRVSLTLFSRVSRGLI